MRLACLLLACLVSMAAVSTSQDASDVIVLKDGRQFAGVIQWETDTHVGLKVDYGLVQFEKVLIQDIQSKGGIGAKIRLRGRKGIMNLAGPDDDEIKAVAGKPDAAKSPAAHAVTAKEPFASADPVASKSVPEPTRPASDDLLPDRIDRKSSTQTSLPMIYANIKQRLGPFFPERPSTQIALALVLFLIILGLVQVGCRFIDIESFSLARGLLFNVVLILVVLAGYTMRDMLTGPLHVVLAVLGGFVIVATAAAALFQEHAGKSTLLVSFVLIAGSICVTCITVGVIGVVNLY